MINQFWGLREQPFGVTPDPRYLYFGPKHRETLASLFCGIEANRGFLALIAQPGMGKTTLLFHLLEKFRHSARTAFLFQTQCSSRELLRFLLAEFGIESKENDLVGMHEQFNRYLMEQSVAGNRVIVVIDEAHNLEPSALETVRLLSDFESPRAKLLQIILAGQPELAIKLASPSLRQLRQRIASFNGLDILAPQEVARFIDHRLHVAGYQGPPLFSDKAKAMIADLSEGIPRNINSLCFGALTLACALGQKTIETEIVDEVFSDLDLRKLIPPPQNVALPRHSTNWSSQLAAPGLASLSQTVPRPMEARPTPTGIVAFPGTRSDLDGAKHNVDMRGRGRRWSYSVSRIVCLVLLVSIFGSGTKRLTQHNPDKAAPSSISKISDTEAIRRVPAKKISDAEAVRLAPADTQPKHVQNSTMHPKRVKEGSTSAEIRLATLYLDRSGVEQNCEQAHLLLVVASRHGSRVANDLLNGKYAERCP